MIQVSGGEVVHSRLNCHFGQSTRRRHCQVATSHATGKNSPPLSISEALIQQQALEVAPSSCISIEEPSSLAMSVLGSPRTQSLTEQSNTLRQELKEWEKTFAAANGGRKAGRDDIKKDAVIGIIVQKFAPLLPG
jgi:hypothetical protein